MHEKESCEAGFSACSGSRKRHSSVPLQCDPRGAFLSYGNEVSYTIKITGGAYKPHPLFLSYRKLRFHTIKTLREDRTAAERKNVACATRCRRRILLRRILFHASDLEYAFFIWLLSSNNTLSSVSSVSFCSIAAISAFACCRSAFLTAGSCSAAKRAS